MIQQNIFDNQKAAIYKYTPNQIITKGHNSFQFEGYVRQQNINFKGFNRNNNQNVTLSDCYVDQLMCSESWLNPGTSGSTHSATGSCRNINFLFVSRKEVICPDEGGSTGGGGINDDFWSGNNNPNDGGFGNPYGNPGGGGGGSDSESTIPLVYLPNINNLLTSPILNSENSDDIIEKQIDATQLNPCSSGVFQQLKNTKVCDIAQVLTKLGADGSLYNTIIKSQVAPSGAPAQTIRQSAYNYTVYISTDYTGKTKLFIAASMFHELVHAYFMSLFDDFYNANPPNLNAYNDFAGLFHYYVTLKRPSSINPADVHHQQMATDYVDAIARALQEYQTGIPVSIGTSPDQIYSDLAWGGLSDAPVFDATYPVGNPNRQRILNRYQAEQQGSPAGQGTPNQQNPIGQPCN